MPKDFTPEEKKTWAISRTKVMLQGLDGLAAKFNEEAHQNLQAREALKEAANAIRAAQQKNEKLEQENQKLAQELAELKKTADAPLMGNHAIDRSLITAISLHKNYVLTKSAIDHGADLNERDENKFTPLMWAVFIADKKIIELLIKNGADLDAKDVNGDTALDHAKRHITPWKLSYPDIYAEITKQLEDAAKPQAAPITVLIDGSGSMWGSERNPSKLQRALDATWEASAAGADVSVVLWGDRKLVPISVTPGDFQRAAEGLGCGTEFVPVLDYIKDNTQSQHFVIMSDGETADDLKELVSRTAELLKNPKISLDFVVLDERKDTQISRFAQQLQDQYPSQVTIGTYAKNNNMLSNHLKCAANNHGAYHPKKTAQSAPVKRGSCCC